MKILYLNYEFPPLGGGGSPVSYEIARGYARRGHTVDVVTMGFRDLPSREEVEGISISAFHAFALERRYAIHGNSSAILPPPDPFSRSASGTYATTSAIPISLYPPAFWRCG